MTNKKADYIAAPIIIGVVILAALFFFAGLLPIDTMWGFNHLKYLPMPYVLAYIIIFLIIFLPPTNSFLRRLVAKFVASFNRVPKPYKLIVLFLLSIAVFYLARAQVHSLGDGYQRIYQIEKGYFYYYSEPLDFFAHAVLFRVLEFIGLPSGELTYIVFSIGAGTFFILSIYLLGFAEKSQPLSSGLFKCLVVFLGGLQLFFGYVESYSLYYLFTMLYILFAANALMENRGLMKASIMLALASLSHITALFLLPGYICLLYFYSKPAGNKRVDNKILSAMIVGLPVIAIIAQEIWLRVYVPGAIPSLSGGILPFLSAEEYSVLSVEHIYDILNQFLLIAPASFALILYLIFGRQMKGLQAGVKIFGWATIIPAGLMLLLVDPKLGFARDWDLFSIPVAAIAVMVFIFFIYKILGQRLKNYTKFLLVSTALVFLSAWISVNGSAGRQLQRAEDLLSLSAKGRGYSTELLAYYYRFVAGDSQKALELLNGITGKEKNARVYNKIAKMYMDMEKYEEALKAIYKGLEIDSTLGELHLIGGTCWVKLNRPDLAITHLQRAVIYEPDRIEAYQSLATAYYQIDSLRLANLLFKEILEINPNHSQAYFEIANMYRLMKIYDSALVFIKQGLKLNPNFPGGITLLEMIKSEAAAQYNSGP